MKSILALVVALSSLSAFGATALISNQAATNATAVSTPAVVQTVQLYSTNTSPTLFYLYDGSLTVTNGAYTNFTSAIGTKVETYIGANGLTNTWTNTVITITANPVAEATAARTPLAALVVPANNVPVTYTLNQPFTFSVITSNNLAGLSGVITYRTP